VDCDCRVVLLVHKESGVRKPADLAGVRMVFGSRDAAEATLLPIHFLKQEGVDVGKLQVVSLAGEVDEKGNPCASEWHVFEALKKGRAQAGIVGERLWADLQKKQPAEAAKFTPVWTSPRFSHCVFTARKDFDRALGESFTRLMVEMDARDSLCQEVLKLEGAGKWVAGSQDGFEVVFQALRETGVPTFARQK